MIRRSVLIVPATIESALIDLIFAASIVASAILAFVTAPSWIAAEPMEPYRQGNNDAVRAAVITDAGQE